MPDLPIRQINNAFGPKYFIAWNLPDGSVFGSPRTYLYSAGRLTSSSLLTKIANERLVAQFDVVRPSSE